MMAIHMSFDDWFKNGTLLDLFLINRVPQDLLGERGWHHLQLLKSRAGVKVQEQLRGKLYEKPMSLMKWCEG